MILSVCPIVITLWEKRFMLSLIGKEGKKYHYTGTGIKFLRHRHGNAELNRQEKKQERILFNSVIRSFKQCRILLRMQIPTMK